MTTFDPGALPDSSRVRDKIVSILKRYKIQLIIPLSVLILVTVSITAFLIRQKSIIDGYWRDFGIISARQNPAIGFATLEDSIRGSSLEPWCLLAAASQDLRSRRILEARNHVGLLKSKFSNHFIAQCGFVDVFLLLDSVTMDVSAHSDGAGPAVTGARYAMRIGDTVINLAAFTSTDDILRDLAFDEGSMATRAEFTYFFGDSEAGGDWTLPGDFDATLLEKLAVDLYGARIYHERGTVFLGSSLDSDAGRPATTRRVAFGISMKSAPFRDGDSVPVGKIDGEAYSAIAVALKPLVDNALGERSTAIPVASFLAH